MSQLTINKKVVIYRKADASEFSKRNHKVLPVGVNKIGSAINPIKAMTVHSDMMKELMPDLLGVSKNAQTFEERVAAYWDSLAVNIPETGKDLEIGFIYDLRASSKIAAIGELKGADDKVKKFPTEKQLADYVEDHVVEEDKWRYGKPIHAADYLLWRYCLGYKAVANDPSDYTINKSPDIRFYIHNEVDIKKAEKKGFETRTKAGAIYFDVISEPDKVKSYLFALGHGTGAIMTDELGRAKLLETIYLEKPQRLIDAKTDKQLEKKAYIEECIVHGILRRLPNSTVVVNASDNSAIGNNMEDAIVFLDQSENTKVANEIEGKLRVSIKK